MDKHRGILLKNKYVTASLFPVCAPKCYNVNIEYFKTNQALLYQPFLLRQSCVLGVITLTDRAICIAIIDLHCVIYLKTI